MGSVCTLEECSNLGVINFLRALEDFVFVSLEFFTTCYPMSLGYKDASFN